MMRPIALVCSALLLATACGKKKESGPADSKADTPAATAPTTRTDPPAASGGACDFAPPGKVSAALGLPGFTLKDGRTVGHVTICTYQRSEKPRSILIRVEKESGKPAFEAARSQVKDKLQEVAGLGDSAFTYQEGGGNYVSMNLVVLKGATSIMLSQMSGDPARMKELAAQIAAAL